MVSFLCSEYFTINRTGIQTWNAGTVFSKDLSKERRNGLYSIICKACRAFYRIRDNYPEVLRIIQTRQEYMKVLADLAGKINNRE